MCSDGCQHSLKVLPSHGAIDKAAGEVKGKDPLS